MRGQYAGYRATPGVAPRSTTETYAALELRIDNERWRGVPFYIRTGKHLALYPDRAPPDLPRRLAAELPRPATKPSANELVLRIDPATGLRIILEAHRADAPAPSRSRSSMDFAHQGGEGPTPYETLFEAALTGDRSPFTRQETVEEAWRIVQPLLDSQRRTQLPARDLGPASRQQAPPRRPALAPTVDTVMHDHHPPQSKSAGCSQRSWA